MPRPSNVSKLAELKAGLSEIERAAKADDASKKEQQLLADTQEAIEVLQAKVDKAARAAKAKAKREAEAKRKAAVEKVETEAKANKVQGGEAAVQKAAAAKAQVAVEAQSAPVVAAKKPTLAMQAVKTAKAKSASAVVGKSAVVPSSQRKELDKLYAGKRVVFYLSGDHKGTKINYFWGAPLLSMGQMGHQLPLTSFRIKKSRDEGEQVYFVLVHGGKEMHGNLPKDDFRMLDVAIKLAKPVQNVGSSKMVSTARQGFAGNLSQTASRVGNKVRTAAQRVTGKSGCKSCGGGR